MKKVSFKGVKANLPDNVSISCFKDIVNDCGKDYSITVQSVLDLLSRKLYPRNGGSNIKTVSYKLEIENRMWAIYNVNQVKEFESKNRMMIGIIKNIEKEYNKNPSLKNFEQFFYAISKLEWL